jgi:hypothetical protein
MKSKIIFVSGIASVSVGITTICTGGIYFGDYLLGVVGCILTLVGIIILTR